MNSLHEIKDRLSQLTQTYLSAHSKPSQINVLNLPPLSLNLFITYDRFNKDTREKPIYMPMKDLIAFSYFTLERKIEGKIKLINSFDEKNEEDKLYPSFTYCHIESDELTISFSHIVIPKSLYIRPELSTKQFYIKCFLDNTLKSEYYHSFTLDNDKWERIELELSMCTKVAYSGKVNIDSVHYILPTFFHYNLDIHYRKSEEPIDLISDDEL